MNIKDIGVTVGIGGLLLVNEQTKQGTILLYPNTSKEDLSITVEEADLDRWNAVIKQSDVVEVELLAEEQGNLKKVLYRKSQRAIDGNIQWSVFKRDNYSCRYCNKSGVPLSVDHIDLWELGGATIEENLLTACKKCNKARGNMPYEEWLNSSRYQKVSSGLTVSQKKSNLEIVNQLPDLESKRVIHKRSR